MHWSFYVIEFAVYALALVLVPHARREGKQWVSTYACGVIFGTLLELLIVSRAGASYRYGTFVVMLGPEGKQVPLWVGIGWGAILYVSTWTAQRLRLSRVLRPLAAGTLAVNVDLSLDPIAERLGFWDWLSPPPVNLYGVPFDNFLAWFAIVASYSFFVREGFHRFPPNRMLSFLWVPPLAVVCALLTMIGVQKVAGLLYELPGGQTSVFVAVFGLACWFAWSVALRSRRDLPFSVRVLAVPVGMHGLSWFLLFATKSFEAALLSSLIVFIPVNFFVGFLGFSWVSLDHLFPESARRSPAAGLVPLPLSPSAVESAAHVAQGRVDDLALGGKVGLEGSRRNAEGDA